MIDDQDRQNAVFSINNSLDRPTSAMYQQSRLYAVAPIRSSEVA